MVRKAYVLSFCIYFLSVSHAFGYPINQNDVVCGDQALNVPMHFPFTKDEAVEHIYLNVLPDCKQNDFTVILGLTTDCIGENFCLHGSFSKTYVKNLVSSKLDRALSNSYQTVNLVNNSQAYYIPSSCAAYCTEADLIWFSGSHVYALGVKQFFSKEATFKELVKSANSYILSQTKSP